jgi:hypothetical protein
LTYGIWLVRSKEYLWGRYPQSAVAGVVAQEPTAVGYVSVRVVDHRHRRGRVGAKVEGICGRNREQ